MHVVFLFCGSCETQWLRGGGNAEPPPGGAAFAELAKTRIVVWNPASRSHSCHFGCRPVRSLRTFGQSDNLARLGDLEALSNQRFCCGSALASLKTENSYENK